jgi:hypothetical protein
MTHFVITYLWKETIMKHTSLFIASIIILFIITGCGKETEKPVAANQQRAVQQQPAQEIMQGTVGKVIEKINDREGYTFVLIDAGKENFWAAAPEFRVSVGDMVSVPEGTRMTNFHNKPLNRDFDTVVFVDTISPAPSGKSASAPSAVVPAAATASKVK